jgi:glutathione S-transferase
MSQTLTFYTNPMSRGRIVRWMLEEVGQPYETVLLDYGTTMKAPEYLAINPMGKVPAIRHGDTVVTEGAAICAYLADAFPDAGWRRRRAIRCAGLIIAGCSSPRAGGGGVTGKSLGLLAPADKKAMAGYGSFEETIDALERCVLGSGPYICGEQFTAADVYVGSQIGWGMMFGSIDSARPSSTIPTGSAPAPPPSARAKSTTR